MTFSVPDYWPALATGQQCITQMQTDYYGAPVKGTLHRYVKRGTVGGQAVYRQDDYNGSGWLDAWEMRYDAGRALWLEVADAFPPVGGVAHHKVYEVGKEIVWGGTQDITTPRQSITQTVHVNVAASTGETSGPGNWGTQIVTFEDRLTNWTHAGGLTFPDVIQVKMFQSFCLNAGCAWPSGQATWITRHWFALGLGIVQTEYLQTYPAGVWSPTRFDYCVAAPLICWETP